MKKFISLFLSVLMLFGTLLPANAAASGDTNGDGRTDREDAAFLSDYLAGTDWSFGKEPDEAGDCNADGLTDARDLAVLRRFLGGYLAELPGTSSPRELSNLYDFTKSYCGFPDENGYNFYSYLTHTSAAVPCVPGDTLTYGPVLPDQAVYVTAFGTDGKVKERVASADRLLTAAALPDGMLICSYPVPEGTASVCLTCPSVCYNTFLVTKNDPFTRAEYAAWAEAEDLSRYVDFRAARFASDAKGASLLWCGDSIGVGYYEHEYPGTAAAGLSSKTRNSGLNPAWAQRIASILGMGQVKNTSKGGASLSTKRADVTNVYTQLRNNAGDGYDYIVIEGGSVDVGGSNGIKAPLGTIGEGYALSDLDPENTFLGALERSFYYATQKAPSAHIVFLIPYSMPEHPNNANAWEEYWKYVPYVCEKWGIPYIDLYNNETVNRTFDLNRKPGGSKSATAFYTDTLHVSPMGYDVTALEIAMEVVTLPTYDAARRTVPSGLPGEISRTRTETEPPVPVGGEIVNLYDPSRAFFGRMDKDGTEIADSAKYVTCAPISAAAGDTLCFAPAVPAQGYQLSVFDAGGKVIAAWVKGSSMTVFDRLDDGKVIYTYVLPKGAASVRVTLPVGSNILITLNRPFSAAEYRAAIQESSSAR